MHRVGWMSLRVCLVLAVALGGCQRGAGEGAARVEAPKPDAAADAAPDGASRVGSAAADSGASSVHARQVKGLYEVDRRADFERQDRIALPGGVAPAVAALVPKGEQFKLVEVAVRRGLRKARPAPGERTVALRWVTTLRGEALARALSDAVRAGGWSTEAAPSSPVDHPTLGRLSWEVGEPETRASWVQVEVVDRDAEAPKAIPVASFVGPPAWLAAAPTEPPVGVEFGRYHGRRLGTVFSEFEHFIGAWPSTEPAAVVARLEAAVAAAGYTRDDDMPGLWRQRGGSPTSFTTRIVEAPGAPSVVIVHHQRRWIGEQAPDEGSPGDTAPRR